MSLELGVFKRQILQNMGPRGRKASSRRRGGTVQARQAAPQQRQTTAQERRSARQKQAAGASQIAPHRVPEVHDLIIEGDPPRNQRNMAQQRRPQRESPGGRPAARQRQGRGRTPGRLAAQSRAVVVNLDGASSSESEGEQKRQQTPDKMTRKALLQDENREDLHITLSPDKMSRGIMSDSSDSEDEPKLSTASPPSHTPVVRQPLNSFNNSPSSSSVEDIFGLDYSVCNTHALQEAFKEIRSSKVAQSPPLPALHGSSSSSRPARTVDSDEDCIIEECPADSRKRQYRSDNPDSPPSSPVLFDMDTTVQSKDSHQSTREKRKRNNKFAAKSTSQLDNLRKERMNDSLDLNSDVILSDGEEEDVNPEIRVLIKWGSESFRLPIRRWQKFSHLYEALGEKYRVSTDRVVLNFKDKIINPAHCPGDLKVTIADCIEGGIQSLQSSGSSHQAAGAVGMGVLAASKDPNSILLRVQSSEKKGFVTVSLGLKETMSILMHKYAEEKQLSLDKLQFCFDGEVLNPRSTPDSLDMEGGECIDVYILT